MSLDRKCWCVLVVAHFAWTWPAGAELESGVYQTLPAAMVEESGDRVPNESRSVPLSAILTFDLAATPPSLTAGISNAVLEGGTPFALTVHSSTGEHLFDGSYRFRGDYLLDMYPSQYVFDWRFSTDNNGSIAWNGDTYWAGGHLWRVTISNIVIVPEPGSLTLIGAGAGALLAFRVRRTSSSGGSDSMQRPHPFRPARRENRGRSF